MMEKITSDIKLKFTEPELALQFSLKISSASIHDMAMVAISPVWSTEEPATTTHEIRQQ